MGVYIEGMEMPESGTYEVSIDSTNGKDKTVMSMFVRGEGGLICCGVYELISVPPHGRLGDLDALHKLFLEKGKEFKGIGGAMLAAAAWCIANAPTIIPAEEGE